MRAKRDGFTDRIRRVEHVRDPARAQRLLQAYEQMRCDAAADKVLDFDLLAGWQRTVLGIAAAPFRDGPAFAKGGRELYGLHANTPARFAECLADSRNHEVPVAARAARVYLDVCFFHPFADGNARSALLALAFVLGKDGVVLDEVGPIAQVQRPADDAEGALGFADLVVAMIEGTQRRLDRRAHAVPTD
ncbi:Fic family protein [Nocardia otitidiscaviarum]|uniref:Fic family protein n=1 Tax=Nocardia otitidiscaviarum TaxID=1823 RepID=UPI001C8F4840|nr:Fic family protein [Nocardia otitidiscaviarum]